MEAIGRVDPVFSETTTVARVLGCQPAEEVAGVRAIIVSGLASQHDWAAVSFFFLSLLSLKFTSVSRSILRV